MREDDAGRSARPDGAPPPDRGRSLPQDDAACGLAGASVQDAPARPLTAADLEYRAAVLRDIAARVRRDGPHAARPHADRARQFMPFAALKGYHELARAQERTTEARHETTEEEAAALSRTVAALRKGDAVRVVHYENGGYRVVEGAVSAVDQAFRTIAVAGKRLAFEDVLSVERLQ